MIEQIVTPVSHDLGQFAVRRAIPSRERTMVGPFIFVDQFGPAQLDIGAGMDVRPHPHINLATVTWLFEGAIDHRDSLGSFATIRPGQVNLMTAGRGIVHSERSPQDERDAGPRLYGMQTWLALPDGREEIDPAFEAVTDLPVVEDGGAKAIVIMGELWGKRARTTAHSATIYAEIVLAPGGSLPIDAEADERAVMLVGAVTLVVAMLLGSLLVGYASLLVLWAVVGIGIALGNPVKLRAGGPEARDYGALGLPTVSDCPEMRIEFIASEAPPADPGELGAVVAPPAIANTLFSTTGLRLRRLPLLSDGI